MENLKEYIVFHETKWDDIYDNNGNVVMPRKNNYWLSGFFGIDDCKDWVADGHQRGSRMGAVTLENIFAVQREKLVPFENFRAESGEPIIVCVKTIENVHRWKEVLTMQDAEAFVKNFNNISEVFACNVFDTEFID